MMCNNQELLVGLIYDDLDEKDRQAVEEHLASCLACRDEVAGLRSMRGHLAAWMPPERDLGFQIVRGAPAVAAAATVPRRFRVSPAWGLAAAAVLVLAAATAIANIEIRYDSNGLILRTGWGAATERVAATSPPIVPADWRADLEGVNRRLQELEAAAAARDSGSSVRASGPRMSDAELLRQVRQLLNQSETRQQRELALRIRQVMSDVDMTRRTDLARFQQGLGQLQGVTSAEVASQREVINYLVRVANQK